MSTSNLKSLADLAQFATPAATTPSLFTTSEEKERALLIKNFATATPATDAATDKFVAEVAAGALVIDTDKVLAGETVLNYAQLESEFVKAGNATGDVELSGEKLGVALFYSAKSYGFEPSVARALYVRQREAQAARTGAKLDLADDKVNKSVSAQASKLGAFINAAKHGKVETSFMVHARHAVRNLPKSDKPQSTYNALLTIMRAQKDAKAQLTEPEMLALFVAEPKEEKTELQKLESLLKACEKIGKDHPAADINAIFTMIRKSVLVRTAGNAAKVAADAKAEVEKAEVAVVIAGAAVEKADGATAH